MLVGQTAAVGRQVCWSIKQLGWIGNIFVGQTVEVGRYIGRSNSWGR